MLAPDQTLGAYRLIGRIGAGGMGEVWKAEDTRLGRMVAIKILPPAFAADTDAIARLRREARTAAQLNHPNIATIHAIEEAEGRLFIAMEFVEGETLANIIRRGGLTEAELCRIGRSVADALAEAHGKGIVHRDIKPDNIIVNGPRVKVLDFGIAKHVGVAGSSADAPTATFMTQQGMIVGTIHYMSPEQALGKPLDPRTDIFSLGVVLYEAATGRLPFRGETITDTMTQIIRDEPQEPLRVNPSISPGLSTIIQRCMRKNRDERFATASDLGHALDQQLGRASTARYPAASTVLTGSRLETVAKPRRRMHWAWIAAAIVLLIAAATVAVMKQRPAAPVSSVAAGAPPAGPAITTTAKPSAPATASVSVTAPPPTATIEELNPPAPVVKKTVPPPPKDEEAPKPVEASAHDHFQNGEGHLFNRELPKAIEEFQLALDRKEDLDERERVLSHLGVAISMHNRPQAERLSREAGRRWPDDPDLLRIRREFAGMTGGPNERPVRRRPRP